MRYPPASLGAQPGRVVELRHENGEIVHGKLLAFDPDDHEDVTYEVVRIVSSGNPPARGTMIGATVVAELHELVGWRRID
ncbi:MAG TPA: hypothetical protein VH438_16165 [Gemmatimonadales bacterium]|jgi:hypothetical protein